MGQASVAVVVIMYTQLWLLSTNPTTVTAAASSSTTFIKGVECTQFAVLVRSYYMISDTSILLLFMERENAKLMV